MLLKQQQQHHHHQKNATGYELSIPMPGHAVATSEIEQVQETVARITRLIEEHDFIFLLMDSRESRWLPTLLASAFKKVC
jgi:ubiquitin-like modifier-activating enzyme ATG7